MVTKRGEARAEEYEGYQYSIKETVNCLLSPFHWGFSGIQKCLRYKHLQSDILCNY